MNEAESNTQIQKPKTSKLAIGSMLFGPLFSLFVLIEFLRDTYGTIPSTLGIWKYLIFVFGFLSIVSVPFSLVIGIIAIRRIRSSKGKLGGCIAAMCGISAASISLAIIGYLMLNTLSHKRSLETAMSSATNLKAIGIAMKSYSEKYDGEYPPGGKWCDFLVEHTGLPEDKLWVRMAEGDKIANYVINENILKLGATAPSEMVLVYETEYVPGDEYVWNLCGSPERFGVFSYFGKRCNILFKGG